jgi:uncharacterized BrkB/YihY/UPF0761 family membrane protein
MTTVRTMGSHLHPYLAKIIEDNLLMLASMLAFNLLMSLVPILVLILVGLGFLLDGVAPHVKEQLIAAMSATSSHGAFTKLALYRLTSMATWAVMIIVVIPSIWFGSEFFVTTEYCFTRIYHIPARPFLRQRLMALQMLGIFLLLIPLLVGVGVLPRQLKRNTIQAIFGASPWSQGVFMLVVFLTDWLIAASFFFIIYLVIPRGRARQIWKGTLIAGALLALYVVAFPFLAGGDLSAKNDAANAGFALAMLGFFYFFSVFLLLGATINAMHTSH